MSNIVRRIEQLPPLPKTVMDVMDFSKQEDKTCEDLIVIIKDDALLIAMLLKTANSALFGFRNKVETIKNLVNLLGVDFTVSLVLSNSLQSSFDIDFSPYGIDVNKFRDNTILSVNFLNIWISRVDIELKKRLLLPVTIMDIGKYILSNEINKLNRKDEFLAQIEKNPQNLELIEKKYCGFSSKETTIMILEHWKIEQRIIDYIKNSSSTDKSNNILDIVKTICNIVEPLGEESIKNGLIKAKQCGCNMKILNNTIDKIKDRLDELE